MDQLTKIFASVSVSLALWGCAAGPSLQEVAPQTFRASASSASSGTSQELWQGLYQRAQAHCEGRQRIAVGLQELGRGQGGHADDLALIFKCDAPAPTR